ncbi:hypothetical protein JY742_09975 [Clostridioides difficile]|nr:hypothetical protein [Clostridioides difficile]
MVFKSLDDLVAYTKVKIAASMPEVGEEMKEIMKEEVVKQAYGSFIPTIYERTGDLLDASEIAEITANSVTSEIKDNGGWSSLRGGHFFPMYGFEGGSVWTHGSTREEPKFRPQTNIMDESKAKAQERVPKCFKTTMNGLGVPVE